MAMNKAEKKELLKYKRIASLHPSTGNKQPPDLAPPEGNGVVSGWGYNEYRHAVFMLHTERHAHWEGDLIPKCKSQNGVPVYSTELLALTAMRFDVENKCAIELSSIDALISAYHNTKD